MPNMTTNLVRNTTLSPRACVDAAFPLAACLGSARPGSARLAEFFKYFPHVCWSFSLRACLTSLRAAWGEAGEALSPHVEAAAVKKPLPLPSYLLKESHRPFLLLRFHFSSAASGVTEHNACGWPGHRRSRWSLNTVDER